MFCMKCGKELPDDANFCQKCGQRQKAGVSIEPRMPRYETCEIHPSVVEKSHRNPILFSRTKWKFVGVASGPDGQYPAQESAVFEGLVGDDMHLAHRNLDKQNRRQYKATEAAFDELVDKLLKDGWELVGTYGASYYAKQFRRQLSGNLQHPAATQGSTKSDSDIRYDEAVDLILDLQEDGIQIKTTAGRVVTSSDKLEPETSVKIKV